MQHKPMMRWIEDADARLACEHPRVIQIPLRHRGLAALRLTANLAAMAAMLSTMFTR
jgi:hypothetical protein